MATIYGTSSNGKKYAIGSQKGQDFINSAAAGATLTGADGSTWTKNSDGSTTIVQNGQSYTVGGGSTPAATGSSNNSGGGSSSASSNTGYNWSSGSNGYGSSYGTDANGQRDYSVEIRDAMNAGASWQTVNDLLNQRTQKAEDLGYTQWKYDDLYSQAQKYIDEKQNGYLGNYMNQLGGWYSDVQSQQEAAQRAAVEQAVNELSGQKTGISQSYDDLYRQLYINRRNAEKNLPQQLAAMGITGGMSESTALGLQTDYNEALRQGEIEKLSTLNDIDRAITDARLSGDIGIAQQAAQLALDKIATYGNLVSQLQNQQNYYDSFLYRQQQDAISNSQWQQSFDRQQALDQLSRDDLSYDRKLQVAQYLYENTGDASGFKALGFTDSQIAALQYSYALAMQQAMSGSSGNYSSSGDSSNGADYNGLFSAAYASGYPRSFIANHYKEYGFTSQTGLADEYDQWLLSQITGDQKKPEDDEEEDSGKTWFGSFMDKLGQAAGISSSSSSQQDASLSDLDTASVRALGIGPVDFSTVEKLVEQKKLQMYQSGNKIGVKWADGYNANNYNNSGLSLYR